MDIEIDNSYPPQPNPAQAALQGQLLLLLKAKCLLQQEYAHLSSGQLDKVVVPIPHSRNQPQLEQIYPGVNELKMLKDRQKLYLASLLEKSLKTGKKAEEETKLDSASYSQIFGGSATGEGRKIKRCCLKDGKIKITPKRRENMFEILKKFKEEKSQKSKKIVEKYFKGEMNFSDFDADFRSLLKKSKMMKFKASRSVKKIEGLFGQIDKSAAENLECKI
jgi:hypothetical protein